jgi:methylthioribose-1-phosphate isomerase
MKVPRTIEWIPDQPGAVLPGKIRLIDQTRLPTELLYIQATDITAIWNAIRNLQVRGAPAIGIAAAMGVALAVQQADCTDSSDIVKVAQKTADYLATSRPTAVNLFWSLDRMKQLALANIALPPAKLKEAIAREAVAIRDNDAAMCRKIGEFGQVFVKDGDTILTHCNAGSLATAEFGSALAPVYTALEHGIKISVFADETRPLLQGARLTAWELTQAGIDVTLICDNMAGRLMKDGRINAVLVGADRIAANGDTANKTGTYSLAVLARAHSIPFYVLAPTTTFDLHAPSGREIPIEERSPDEITNFFGRRTAPEGVKIYNPAFDITPGELITAIVCERGIARPDYSRSLPAMAKRG